MNTRIKRVRKHLKLSQAEFGKTLGISRDTVANIEGDRIEIKDIFVASICREYHVNEHWLRTGEGEMFNQDDIPLNNLLNDLDPLELSILKAYFSLDKDVRKKAIEHFKKHLS